MVFQDMMGLLPDNHRSLFDVFKCRMDVGNSPPEFSDRCLAARAPEAQLDGKQQVLVAVIAIAVYKWWPVLWCRSGLRPEQSRGQEV